MSEKEYPIRDALNKEYWAYVKSQKPALKVIRALADILMNGVIILHCYSKDGALDSFERICEALALSEKVGEE